MAGTVVVTPTSVGNGTARFMRYVVSWVATAGGAVSANPFTVPAGYISQVRFTPGTPTPTTLYDVTISDGDVADIIGGVGADNVVTGGVLKNLNPPVYQDGSRQLDVVVANAGSGGAGSVTLMISTPMTR